MNLEPGQFEGMLSSVIESQGAEVALGKQPVLADYGREVRLALNALPPEASAGLTAGYQEPGAALLGAIAHAIDTRGEAADNAAQRRGIDQQWLGTEGGARAINEAALAGADSWNPAPPAAAPATD